MLWVEDRYFRYYRRVSTKCNPGAVESSSGSVATAIRPLAGSISIRYGGTMIQIVNPAQASTLITQGTVDVVDVREPNEWQTGHIPNARLVPLNAIKATPKDLLPHDGVIFVCARGARSLAAARVAESIGLRQLYSLEGGTQGWATAGLPLVRD